MSLDVLRLSCGPYLVGFTPARVHAAIILPLCSNGDLTSCRVLEGNARLNESSKAVRYHMNLESTLRKMQIRPDGEIFRICTPAFVHVKISYDQMSLINLRTTSLHSLLIAVVLDLIVDISRFPVHRVEGSQAAVLKIVKQIVLLDGARGTLGLFGRHDILYSISRVYK